MPRISDMSPTLATWEDDASLPLQRPGQPVGSRDPRTTLGALRTATAEFNNKALGAGCSVGSDSVSIRVKATRVRIAIAEIALAGSVQGDATAISVTAADRIKLTGADAAKGAILPAALAGDRFVLHNSVLTAGSFAKIYPASGGAINGLSANVPLRLLAGETLEIWAESATQWRTSGRRVASGQLTTAAAVTTVVTGLDIVRSVVASLETDPADANLLASAQIGDQAGSPAAGSVVLKLWKTDGSDPTPAAATSFGAKINWIAEGY